MLNCNRCIIMVLGILLVFSPPCFGQTVVLNEHFNTYANGNLVGQFGWTQLGPSSTVPIQVLNGQVLIPVNAPPPIGGVDNQDAYKLFSQTLNSPGSVFVGMDVTISASFTVSSYFFAMSDSPAGNANFRLTARDSPLSAGQVEFGARVTGETGYPYAFGAPLNYDQKYRIVLQAEMNTGAQNDRVRIFIDPTDGILGNQTPYATGVFTSGSVTDPTSLGLAILSQFYADTSGQSGVAIDNIVVADSFAAAVPEPTTYALIGLSFAGVGVVTIYRRRRQKQENIEIL